jgi:hypothetical protein
MTLLSKAFPPPAYCLTVHGRPGRRTVRSLADRCAGFITSNTVPNEHAMFDVAPLIADVLVASAARRRELAS